MNIWIYESMNDHMVDDFLVWDNRCSRKVYRGSQARCQVGSRSIQYCIYRYIRKVLEGINAGLVFLRYRTTYEREHSLKNNIQYSYMVSCVPTVLLRRAIAGLSQIGIWHVAPLFRISMRSPEPVNTLWRIRDWLSSDTVQSTSPCY